MKKDILVIDPNTPKDAWAKSYISLQPFTSFLQDRIASGEGTKTQYFQYILDKILARPELQGYVGINDIQRHEDILELVSTVIFPIMEDENEFLWAFGNALTPEVFYGSNAFYKLFSSASQRFGKDSSYITPAASRQMVDELQLELVLQKIYHYKTDQRKEWIHGFINPATGLYQYYRVNIDRRFTSLSMNESLPPIDQQAIETCMACADGLRQLGDMLPLKSLVASGFTIITLIDVTAKHALDQISREVAGFHLKNSTAAFTQLTLLLQTIAENQHYQFGVMPIFTINDRAALLYENFPFSIIVKACSGQGVPKRNFDLFIKQFLKNPATISHSTLSADKALPPMIENALNKSGIPYYSLAPVYAGTQLVGIFEISTGENGPGNRLQENMLPVMPYIAQLVTHFIDKFNATIDNIIKNQFTNIQPSVQWKFNEVAWHYFRNNVVEKKKDRLETISFGEVYPLYGAVDIQNSTIERNKALRKDLQVQLNHIRDILQLAEKTSLDESNRQMLVACDYWLYQLTDFITIEQELQLNDFLQLEVAPYLLQFQEAGAAGQLKAKVTEYNKATDEDAGDAFFERRKLESSIRMVNTAVGQYLDLFQVELQTTYPCYFEKMRTDGVEYDIYIGQSIAPKIIFKDSYLHATRLVQLQSMAAIASLTHSLLPQLEHPLLTTQLIFVHSRPIDISFRNDERRFDVEGAYNIRYHIIKKRIDKVHVRNTDERLTQTGKIAIVYYNEQSVAEYENYIRQLQEKQVLLNDLEHLELEELQGISGLRALRVGVNLQ